MARFVTKAVFAERLTEWLSGLDLETIQSSSFRQQMPFENIPLEARSRDDNKRLLDLAAITYKVSWLIVEYYNHKYSPSDVVHYSLDSALLAETDSAPWGRVVTEETIGIWARDILMHNGLKGLEILHSEGTLVMLLTDKE